MSKKSRENFARAGGKASAASLTPEQRSERARKAVQARWNKQKSLPELEPGKDSTDNN